MPPHALHRIPAPRTCLAALLLTAVLVPGCKKETPYVAPPPPAVTVSRPLQQAVTDYAEFTGTTEALKSVEIRARVEGYLKSIHFSDSAEVKEGDLLLVIDPRPLQAKLAQAEADLRLREAELNLAETTLGRKQAALQDKAVSEVEVIVAKAERDKTQAAVAAARAAVETARLDLSYTRIHAPISGRIGRHLVDAGNLVGAGERTLLAIIVRDDPIYAYFHVSERDLLSYRQDPTKKQALPAGSGKAPAYLGLSSESGYPHEGCVDYVDTRVDAQTGTIQVRALFPNPDHTLLPGLFARIRLPLGRRDRALLVPEQALGTDQQGRFLLVVGDDNVVSHRTVRIGASVGELRVIENGIAAEDLVVVKGLQRARPGAEVRPEEVGIIPAAEIKPSPKTGHGGNDA